MKNKYDSYLWVDKVIRSCTKRVHLTNCRALIDNFYRLHKEPTLYKILELEIKRTKFRIT